MKLPNSSWIYETKRIKAHRKTLLFLNSSCIATSAFEVIPNEKYSARPVLYTSHCCLTRKNVIWNLPLMNQGPFGSNHVASEGRTDQTHQLFMHSTSATDLLPINFPPSTCACFERRCKRVLHPRRAKGSFKSLQNARESVRLPAPACACQQLNGDWEPARCDLPRRKAFRQRLLRKSCDRRRHSQRRLGSARSNWTYQNSRIVTYKPF